MTMAVWLAGGKLHCICLFSERAGFLDGRRYGTWESGMGIDFLHSFCIERMLYCDVGLELIG